jgi:hypothetical protein
MEVALYKIFWSIESKFGAHTGRADFKVVNSSRVKLFYCYYDSIIAKSISPYP